MTFAPSFDHSALLRGKISRGPKGAQGIARMLTKIARPTKAEKSLDDIRPVVERLVRGETYVTGSKMLAYQNVGRAIGKSSSWVRKLVGRQSVALQHFEFLDIVAAYGALCERVEAAAAAERRRAELLRRETDAALERAGGVVARAPGTTCRGEAP